MGTVPFGVDAVSGDHRRLMTHEGAITRAARKHGFGAAVLGALVSRETGCLARWVHPPPFGRLGDNGHGHGPGQIDDRSFPEWCARWAKGELKIEDGLEMACIVLNMKLAALDCIPAENVQTIHGKVWPQRLRFAIAAYNGGGKPREADPHGVRNMRMAFDQRRDPDVYTTGKDYSADVLTRAAWLESKRFGETW